MIAGAYYRRPLVGLALAAALLIAWRLVALHVDSIFGASAATQDRSNRLRQPVPELGALLRAGMTGAWAYVRLREIVDPALLARRASWSFAVAAWSASSS